MRRVVIVGAGLAGSRCAETLRAEGFDGSVVLLGDEPAAPYERPALSKEFLAGTREEVALRPDSFWSGRGIELLLETRVDRVDLARRVAVAGSAVFPWDALVLATGCRARGLPAAGESGGFYTLRTLADAQVLRTELMPGKRLAVIGAGFVGTEVASTAVTLGVDVVLVEAGAVPLERTLGAEVGALLAERYRNRGVDVRLGAHLEAFRRRADGRPRAVLLHDGTELACDAVLVGVGAEPVSDLLGSRAIPTDAVGRTRFPNVHACGDVAQTWRPSLGQHVRIEHWTNASAQGAATARAILGAEEPDTTAPFFWSDQFGLRLQYVGFGSGWEAVEIDGDPDSFTARYLDHGGCLLAALCANRPRETALFRRELATPAEELAA